MTQHSVEVQHVVNELLADGWLHAVDWFDEIDSTNSAARRGLAGGSLAPALYIAQRQTSGRGRSDRKWWSPSGCLMLTLVVGNELLPNDPDDWGQLALVCGVAVAETVSHFVEHAACQLKWPNDVYVGGRKAAGVLIESAGTHWLIGIGLNVNVDWTAAPDELRARATCLTAASGRSLDAGVVLVDLIQQLQHWIVSWGQGDVHWLDGWRERCLLTGRVIRVRDVGNPSSQSKRRELVGRCEGMDQSGKLILRTDAGVEHFSSVDVVSW